MFFVWSQELFVNKAIACVPAVGSNESVLGRTVISSIWRHSAEADSQASLGAGMQHRQDGEAHGEYLLQAPLLQYSEEQK